MGDAHAAGVETQKRRNPQERQIPVKSPEPKKWNREPLDDFQSKSG